MTHKITLWCYSFYKKLLMLNFSSLLYLVHFYRGHQYCITELLRIAGQVWCTLQRWPLCKHFWSTSWHLEGRQEEENFDLWWRAASAGCSWQCGDNPIAPSCGCCRLRLTEPPDPYSVPLICLYFVVPIYSMNNLVFPETCYHVMYVWSCGA